MTSRTSSCAFCLDIPKVFTMFWAGMDRAVGKISAKVPGSILALPRFEYLCDLLYRLNQLSFPSFRGR